MNTGKIKKIDNLCLTGMLLFGLSLLVLSTGADVYEQQENAQLDYVYVKQDANFTGFDSVIIDPISVWYPEESKPSEESVVAARENLARAQNMFKELIRDELGDSHAIVKNVADNVLRVHVEFVDLRSVSAGGKIPAYFASKKFKTAPGHITLVAELSNSATNEVLARVADLGKRQSSGGSIDVDWDSIESDLRNWAEIFGDWFNGLHTQSEITTEK